MGIQPLVLSFKDVEDFTCDFDVRNLIGKFQLGEIYRGVMHERNVIVKKWIADKFYMYGVYQEGDFTKQFNHELSMFQTLKMKSHLIMADLIGYCNEDEERLAMVLDLDALDSLYNLVHEDRISWVQRMKVLVGVGFFLEAMHRNDGEVPCLLRNFDPKHIILDEDYNPKLIDLNMVSVGEYPKKPPEQAPGLVGCCGYSDLSVVFRDDGWSDKVDVFSLGILIMFMIGKEKYCDDFYRKPIVMWTNEEYLEPEKLKVGNRGYVQARTSSNLIDKRLTKGQCGYYHGDGVALTILGANCLEYRHIDRPTMQDALNALKKLRVFRYFPNYLNVRCLVSFSSKTLRYLF